MRQVWELLHTGLGLSLSGLALAGLLGLLLGAGSYTAYYAEAVSYLSNDPRACVNCHVMRDHYEAWQKSGHGTVAGCNDCHLKHSELGKWATKIRNGLVHSTAFTFQNFHEPIQIHSWNERIVQANCVDCHRELVSQVVELGESRCVHCHAGVGHSLRK